MNANVKSSPWEGKALMHHLRLYRLESSSAEEDLEVLVYSKLNTSQPYAAKAKAQPDKYTDLALFTCDQPFYNIFFLPTTNPPTPCSSLSPVPLHIASSVATIPLCPSNILEPQVCILTRYKV